VYRHFSQYNQQVDIQETRRNQDAYKPQRTWLISPVEGKVKNWFCCGVKSTYFYSFLPKLFVWKCSVCITAYTVI